MMLIIAILTGVCAPAGIMVLLIYIRGKDHGISTQSVITVMTVAAIGFIMIFSPIAFVGSLIADLDTPTSSMVLFAIITVIDIVICIFALVRIISKKKQPAYRILRNIDMVPVNSTEISHIGYKNGTLYVRTVFGGGRIYSYLNVPDNVYEELKSAPSIECYYADHIKCQYECVKL